MRSFPSATSWAMTIPASIVFPSPTSSASMHPPRDSESSANAAASTWWGFKSTFASDSAEASRLELSPLLAVSSSAKSLS